MAASAAAAGPGLLRAFAGVSALAAARKTFVPLLDDFRLSPRLLGAVGTTIELAQQEWIAVAMVIGNVWLAKNWLMFGGA